MLFITIHLLVLPHVRLLFPVIDCRYLRAFYFAKAADRRYLMHVALHTSLSVIVFACAMLTPTDDSQRLYLWIWALGAYVYVCITLTLPSVHKSVREYLME